MIINYEMGCRIRAELRETFTYVDRRPIVPHIFNPFVHNWSVHTHTHRAQYTRSHITNHQYTHELPRAISHINSHTYIRRVPAMLASLVATFHERIISCEFTGWFQFRLFFSNFIFVSQMLLLFRQTPLHFFEIKNKYQGSFQPRMKAGREK